MVVIQVFSSYRSRMALAGASIREANKRHSEQIMDASFNDSQTFRKVIIEGAEYDARIISDSKTTVRGGNGNYVIQLKSEIYFKPGTYVQVPDTNGDYDWWLILYESESMLYPKHIIKRCNYLLKWKNKYGDIIERWAVFSDNNKLMDAERKSFYNKLSLPFYSTSLVLPCDSETINLKMDKRFLIDHAEVDGNPEAWMVVNRNVISKTFNSFEGVIELTLSKHQFNHNVDNKELMIADYHKEYSKNDEAADNSALECHIRYNGTSDLKMGTPYKQYIADVYRDGELDDTVTVSWDVLADDSVLDMLDITSDGNIFKIKCKYKADILNSHIRIIATNEELGISAELPVKVVNNL